ncbi:60S ribosomal protein L30 [Aphelenchoides besseyi]|nr:60S ribosomal protein L30 [Aphelenchoides besseyi]KAI6232272.1 60S ribosomal protein L30 [Aphelenchoides besseyi]
MAVGSQKKSAENINSRLAMVTKSGKYVLGYKQTLRSLRSGKAKLVIISSNTPSLRRSEIEYYAMLSKTGVHEYHGNNIELGTACGKLFRVAVLSITDPGDSDIIRVIPSAEDRFEFVIEQTGCTIPNVVLLSSREGFCDSKSESRPGGLAEIWNFARRDTVIPANAPTEFLRDKHVKFIVGCSKNTESYEYVITEYIRLSGMYWCISALDVCDALKDRDVEFALKLIEKAKNPDGGYGCAEGNDSHVLHTLCAIQVLKILNRMDLVDVEGVVRYIQSLQNADGSFSGDTLKEVDTRFSMCALATLHLLDRLDAVNIPMAVEFVLSCHNFDGGFGTRPGSESHAGQVYCCLGALAICGALETINCERTAEWLAERQCPSGGLCGRPEKLPDVCYSWWVLASLAILRKLHYIDRDSLIKFILASQEDEMGGIADRPGDMPDPFHTVFGISGLSLLKYGDLEAVDPVFCMTKRALGDMSFSL